MDETTKDRIFIAGKDSEYALAVLELLRDRQTDIFISMATPLSGEDLVRIQGAFNEINYLINRIESAQTALEAEIVIETEYPDEVSGDKI